MLAVRFTLSGVPTLSSDPSSSASRIVLSSCCSYSHSQLHLGFRPMRSRRSGGSIVCCQSHVWRNSADGSSGDRDEGRGDDFVQASLLLSETIGHYRGLKYGFVEEMRWQEGSHRTDLFRMPLKEPQRNISSIGQGILRQFQNPTIFLKISCDGDFLLPIAVGGHAIERLADASWEAEKEDYPNQFQFVKNLVLRLGYEVDMVRITKKVRNTYFAKVCLSKSGETSSIFIDIRPADAINIAKRCMAPIYVSKQIATTDAFQIAYGMIRAHPTKCVYDVTLDSPADGPDMLVKELDLVKCMKLAVSEERYSDAAVIRDQLIEFRET
ncbi:hypothetical protein QQ045_012059 [Rhodiola kirilowii]